MSINICSIIYFEWRLYKVFDSKHIFRRKNIHLLLFISVSHYVGV